MSELSPVEVVPTGRAKVIHRFLRTGDSEPRTISFGLDLATFDVPALGTVAAAMHAAFVAEMIAVLSSSWRITETEVRGSPADGFYVVKAGASTAGTGDAETIPSNCALLIEKATSQAGRGKQGRMFLPGGVAESAVGTGGGIESVTLGTKQAAVNDWYDAITAEALVDQVCIFHADYIRDTSVPYDPEVVHQAMIANPAAAVPTEVTGFLVDPIIATQRRRMR